MVNAPTNPNYPRKLWLNVDKKCEWQSGCPYMSIPLGHKYCKHHVFLLRWNTLKPRFDSIK